MIQTSQVKEVHPLFLLIPFRSSSLFLKRAATVKSRPPGHPMLTS